ELGGNAAVLSHYGPVVCIGQQHPHVAFPVILEPVCSGHDRIGGGEQAHHVVSAPAQVVVDEHNHISLRVHGLAEHGCASCGDVRDACIHDQPMFPSGRLDGWHHGLR